MTRSRARAARAAGARGVVGVRVGTFRLRFLVVGLRICSSVCCWLCLCVPVGTTPSSSCASLFVSLSLRRSRLGSRAVCNRQRLDDRRDRVDRVVVSPRSQSHRVAITTAPGSTTTRDRSRAFRHATWPWRFDIPVCERARGRLRALLAQSGCEAQGGQVHFLVLGVRIEAGLDFTLGIFGSVQCKTTGRSSDPPASKSTGIRRRELEGTRVVITTPIRKKIHNRSHTNRTWYSYVVSEATCLATCCS